MKTIELKRWLTDNCYVILAMHPTHSMKATAIFKTCQKLGCPSTFEQIKKTMSLLRGTYIFAAEGKAQWGLTATGAARQAQIINDMKRITTLHKLSEHLHDTSDLHVIRYAPKDEDQRMACVDCKSVIGTPHHRSCRNGVFATPLDTHVTAR